MNNVTILQVESASHQNTLSSLSAAEASLAELKARVRELERDKAAATEKAERLSAQVNKKVKDWFISE